MDIKPLGDRVLLQPQEENEVIQGGIVIPDAAKEKPQQATVIALGTKTKTDDGEDFTFDVKVGDTVLMPKYGGTEVKLAEKVYQIVRQDDILGVIS